MAIYKKVTLTNQGTALMNDLISSSRSLSFTRMATTEQSYSDRNIEELTVIPNEVQTEVIYQQERIGEATIRVEVLISNEELSTSYAINSIGVYATDLEGKEILFGVASAEQAFQMPSSTTGMPTGAIFRLHIGIGQTELATLERAPSGMANVSDIINLQDKIKLSEDEIESISQNVSVLSSWTEQKEIEIDAIDEKYKTKTNELETTKANKSDFATEIERLDQKDEGFTTQFAQTTTDVDSFVKTKQQSMPPKQGVMTNSNKLISKVGDDHFRIVQSTNKGYVYHDLKRGIGGSGSADTGTNYELFRLVKSKKVENAYVGLNTFTSSIGVVETLYAPTKQLNNLEERMFGTSYITIDETDIFSNLPEDVGIGMHSVHSTESESSVTYSIQTGLVKKGNLLIAGTPSSSESAEIKVNGETVRTFNPTEINGAAGISYKIIEFDIPYGSSDELEITLINKDTSGRKLYFSCANFYTLKEYKGQRIDMFKVIPRTDVFIDANGSSDYAFFDVESNKWVGSYHGGETVDYSRLYWLSSYDLRFDNPNRYVMTDPNNPDIKNGDFIVTDSFEIIQQSTLTTVNDKTARINSRFNFDIDGTINMVFSLYDNEIKMSSAYTALTCTHIDLRMMEHPMSGNLPEEKSEEQVYISEGYVRQRDPGGRTVLDNRFTMFNNTYNKKFSPVFISNQPTLYRKLYYSPLVNYTEGITIPRLTFSKALDFYSR